MNVMNKYYYITIGQAYGEGSYSECVYNNTESCDTSGGGTNPGTGTGTGSNTDTNGGGQLTDTGFMVVLIVTLACILLFIALIVRIWKRPSRKPVPQEIVNDDIDSLER